MSNFENIIRSRNLKQQIGVINETISKGGTYPIGTIRTYTDGKKYKKMGDGKWVLYVEKKSKTPEISVGSIDLSKHKAYQPNSRHWAKKKAEKEGKVLVKQGGLFYIVDKDVATALEGNGGKAITSDIKPKVSKKSTPEDFKKQWEGLEDDEKELQIKNDMESMSQERFEGLLLHMGDLGFSEMKSLFKTSIIPEYNAENDFESVISNISNGIRSEGKDIEDHYTSYSSVARSRKGIIKAYTSNAYKGINRFLTGKHKYDVPPHISQFMTRVIDTMSLGLEDAKLTKTPDVVFRGYVSRNSSNRKKECDSKMVEAMMNIGSEFSFGTCTSTSRKTGGMMGNNSDESIIYVITPKANSKSLGRSVEAISHHDTEEEFLYPPQAKFKVQKAVRTESREDIVKLDGSSIPHSSIARTKNVIYLQEI